MNVFYDILLPGFVALLVSSITVFITTINTKRLNTFSEITGCCKKVQSILHGNHHEWFEDDFVSEIEELKFIVKNSSYFNDEFKSLICEKVRTLRYQFSSITREDIEMTELDLNKNEAIETITEIRKKIEDKY